MKRSLLVATIAVVGVSATALAGNRGYDPVFINTTQRYAGGALGAARNSTDNYQYIGCEVDANGPVNGMVVACYAREATGKFTASCFATDPGMIQVALGINGDSFVRFAWDTSGHCTSLSVINDSTMEPKKP